MSRPTPPPLVQTPAGLPVPGAFADSTEARWRTLSEVGQALSGELNPRQLLRELATRMVPGLSDYCVTYLVTGDAIERVGAVHADPSREPLIKRLVQLAPPSIRDEMGAGAAIRTGDPIFVPEISSTLLERAASSGEYLRLLRSLQPISSMVLPLRARGRTVGAIALAMSELSGRRYGPADFAFAQELSQRAALALDNARLYREAETELRLRREAEAALQSRYEQLRVLYDVSEAVGRTRTLEEIYDLTLDALTRALSVDRAAVLLLDSEGVMRFAAWRSLSHAYRTAVEGHTPWAPDSTAPAPVVVPDVERDRTLGEGLRRVVLAEGIRAMAFIPLVFGSGLLGKFMLYFDAPHPFGDEEIELARAVAGTVSFALTRARDERSVREAKEDAERANAAKTRFLGVMSHELRTPLNAIGGYVELLDMGIQGPVTPKQQEALARVAANQRHLLGLINDILSFARLEAGQMEYMLRPLLARELLSSLDALISPLANARGMAYVIEECAAEARILGDEERVRQILVNLVSNAIKYAPPGSWVRVSCEADGAGFAMRVRDNGRGIPADKLDAIFDAFVQVVDPQAPREGAGLGLAISRELARDMGGDLTVRSTPGEGSEFTLWLPVAAEGSE